MIMKIDRENFSSYPSSASCTFKPLQKENPSVNICLASQVEVQGRKEKSQQRSLKIPRVFWISKELRRTAQWGQVSWGALDVWPVSNWGFGSRLRSPYFKLSRVRGRVQLNKTRGSSADFSPKGVVESINNWSLINNCSSWSSGLLCDLLDNHKATLKKYNVLFLQTTSSYPFGD